VRRWLAFGFALAAAFASRGALATSGTAFGESSRAAALGNSVVARPGDAGTILLDPGGLADVPEPELLISGQYDSLRLWWQRDGEAKSERNRALGGIGLAVATPLPGPDWLAKTRVALALHFPADHALRVAVDERSDEPTSPIYSGRADRMSALGAIAYEILPWKRAASKQFQPSLGLGFGVTMTPSLDTPTEVSYDADRGRAAEQQVIIRLDRDLQMEVAPFLGLRVQPLEKLGVGLAYRAAQISRASGKQRTVAGPIVADDPIDFYQFWDPAQAVLGVAGGPLLGLTASVDVTYSRWSRFRTGFDERPSPAFEDTVDLGAGVEWKVLDGLAVRAGYAREPSPIPEQTGTTNYLGADTQVFSLGGGVDLRKLWRAPLAIDTHARLRTSGTQTAHKNAAELGDSNPLLPGQQIDNLGYPGFSSSAKLYQVGLTLTLFVGKEKKP
jgi:hypothetical protein